MGTTPIRARATEAALAGVAAQEGAVAAAAEYAALGTEREQLTINLSEHAVRSGGQPGPHGRHA
jgi:hypothetical protein